MATTISKNVQLAKALPARLLTFLARYPPAAILPDGATPETHKTAYQEETPNPFLPTKHPVTGRWHNPKYSLRRQAELVKMAREHHVEELLPFTPKGTEERLRKRVELGLRVKGTGVGQKVKGHKHERQLQAKYVRPVVHVCVGRFFKSMLLTWLHYRMEKRREAMLKMPELIRQYRSVRGIFRGSLA
jgi:large subunit ribosomal protein L25